MYHIFESDDMIENIYLHEFQFIPVEIHLDN